MKIAFVENMPVAGGIIRYGVNLANAIAKIPGNSVVFYTHEQNYLSNKALYEDKHNSFSTVILYGTKRKIIFSNRIDQLLFKIFGISRESLVKKEILEKTKDDEVVYFTCAHHSFFIPVKGKSIATMHDLNWNYIFGVPLFSKQDGIEIRRNFQKWLENSTIVCSTNFIKEEVIRFFNYQKQIHVIHLSSLSQIKSSSNNDKSVKDLGIEKPYILYPGHLMPHKNHLFLFRAFYELMQNKDYEGKFTLVLTGGGTNYFEYAKAGKFGAEIANQEDYNIRGLGYVKNDEMDSLISNAHLVISPSLYEAGSGPAIDAWGAGIPVIISNIKPHVEQINFYDIDCTTFDPLDLNDCVNALTNTLDNIDEMRITSKKSIEKIKFNNWETVAKQYYEVFSQPVFEQDQ
jgi:glycosyltransferase involved in cell wall biosynthesis